MARTEPRIILICLGNPGPQRAGTRHNAGFLFADYLREQCGFGPFESLEGADCRVAEGALSESAALLVKPNTSLNDCGAIMPALTERYGLDEHLYGIAHDDLDVPLGTVRGRQKGGHGGHNGVRSILETVGRKDLFRIKIGINSARRSDYDGIVDFLLSDFQPDEHEELQQCFAEATDVLLGQVRSYEAELAQGDRRQTVAAAYADRVLEAARSALEEIPAASPYPIFLHRRDLAQAQTVLVALAKLLRKARRAASEDPELWDRLVSFIPADLLPLLPDPSAQGTFIFAVDLHVADDGIKAIELNCAVGYAHYARLSHEALFPLLRSEIDGVQPASEVEFSRFLYEHGLKPLHDPQAGGIAFLRGFNNEDMFNVDELERLAARMHEQGAPEIRLCHQEEMELRDDGLHLRDGSRIDVLYVEENLSDWANVDPKSPLGEAVRGGLVKTFPALDMFAYTNKAFLSLLVDPSSEDWLQPDEAEQQVIRRNLLWSHLLDSDIEPAAYYMLEQGLRLVVKEALGGGGRGVTILQPGSGSQQAGHVLRQRMQAGNSVVQGYFGPGRWSRDSDLRFDVRLLAAAHEGDVIAGPVYGRIFRGDKLSFSEPDAGVVPVYVVE